MSMAFLLSFALAFTSVIAEEKIDLGRCSGFALKAETQIAFNGIVTTVHDGDFGVSPGKGITGKFIANNPPLINSEEAIGCDTDLTIAYNKAVAMTCDPANIFPELGGKSFLPGVYCSTSSMKISASTVTLDGNGDADAQWVFQVPTALTTATATKFILQNGAQSKNVFWALGTAATIGYSSSFVGNILAQTQVTFQSNSVINGRALALTAVVFESGSDVYLPSEKIRDPSDIQEQEVRSDLKMSASPVTPKKNLRTPVKMFIEESVDFNIGDICAQFAVNAGTSVNFDGGVTKITGLVGVSPSTAIQGQFEFTDSIYTELQKNSQKAKDCRQDSQELFNTAMRLPCSAAHTIQGSDLSGALLTPGVYCSATGKFLFSAATIRLDAQGDPDAKWVFQAGTTISTATATSFELLNGAQSSNVLWAIGTSASLGYSSSFVGTIIAGAAVTVGTSTVVEGRLFASTAVTFSDKGVISNIPFV